MIMSPDALKDKQLCVSQNDIILKFLKIHGFRILRLQPLSENNRKAPGSLVMSSLRMAGSDSFLLRPH